MITYLVARAIDVVTPKGFAEYFFEKIVMRGKFTSETMYFKDKIIGEYSLHFCMHQGAII
ncbi:MAG: hypothetical protein CMF67_14445 [Magnetovibrio sp.]|nr:hypothetical protein [Magnetovibrio sp.]